MPYAVVIAGATGLVGGAALRYALDRGHRVIALVRAGQAQDFDRELVGRGLVTLEVDYDNLDKSRDVVGLHGPSFAVGAGPAAATEALVVALDLLEAGDADAFVVVAADHVGPAVVDL